MTIELGPAATAGGDHLVQFYAHDSELVAAVVAYLTDPARAGAATVVIATPAHRRAFEAGLAATGVDVAEARADGSFVSLDAAATIASFMPGRRIDAGAFREVVGAVVRGAGESGRPVQAYGEMVALLWEAGDVVAAIQLERLWNDLGRELRFSLMCAYHSHAVAGPDHADALRQVCDLHSTVLHAPTHDDGGEEVVGRFAADLDAPGAARRFVTGALRRWGHGDVLVDDAELVLSELATNAVLHAGSPFSVAVRAGDSGLRISVRDDSPIPPTIRTRVPMALSGRGMVLVATLARDWGVVLTGEGKTVWAELDS